MKLGLGTVQFGLDYGISNKNGQISQQEVKEILNLAVKKGITIFDTAYSYGDSEEALGNASSPNNEFKMVTKTPIFSEKINLEVINFLEQSFINSLLKLKQKSIYGLLIHDANDLMKNNSNLLWAKMNEFKQRGLVKKIGVSVYNSDQIDFVLDNFDIDLIQLPINILDQRLLRSGCLTKLKNLGVEIHVRSVFLQGLLLMDYEKLPVYFNDFKRKLVAYDNYLKQFNITKLQAALNFVNEIKEIDKIIVGVCSQKQLLEIIESLNCDLKKNLNFEQFACQEEQLLNPSFWKLN